MKVLLVEDDLEISQFITKYLNDKGCSVTTAHNRSDIDFNVNGSNSFDCIVLDRLIETIDTQRYLPDFKKKWPQTPIIVLSAISTPDERTKLLDLGADDYLGKPFSASELFARIQARSRNNVQPHDTFLKSGNTVLDTLKRKVIVNHKDITLPSKEFLLLQILLKDASRVWSKVDLLESIWGSYLNVESNVVETTIMNLRKKLNEIESNIVIKNSRNSGYWIET